MAGFLSGIGNQFIKELGSGDTIKDYQHGARTFIDSNYALSPKMGTLFHVFIDLNTSVAATDQNSQIELGMMAKTVNLPKFTVQTKTYNAYNRKNIAQERIVYDPVTITFHDDSKDIVRDFWAGYYSYYYRDADHSMSQYEDDKKYKQRQIQNWGFTPQLSTAENYISSIRIYSLHQKVFSSYTLIKPTITAFQHGQHQSGEYTPMEHSMTVAYEAVQYESGMVSESTVQGFSVMHYDKTPSPLTSLGGGTTSILGPGGLVDGIGTAITNAQNGNFAAAGLGLFRTQQNFKNSNLKQVASAELAQTAINVLKGQNPQSTHFFPTASSIKDGLAKAVSTNNRS